MHVEILIDFELQSHSARNQGHDKRDEIWMTLITCGSIHQGHEWFSDDSQGTGKGFLCVWRLYCVSNFADLQMELPRYQSSPARPTL